LENYNNYKPGDHNYRAYVGPFNDYDLVSAMVFNLLTCFGLRESHKLLDIGCGSLRCGRLLIPYLNESNYYANEPNQWLIEDAKKVLGKDIFLIKKPNIIYQDNLDKFNNIKFDYILAQSIFSHAGSDILEKYLISLSSCFKKETLFFFTSIIDEKANIKKGWFYPECISYNSEYLKNIFNNYNYHILKINFFHPRQSWFVAVDADNHSLRNKIDKFNPITWNGDF
jgi:cyclopropane fatty-acyl-phospholipid synthase-like methyltransferase